LQQTLRNQILLQWLRKHRGSMNETDVKNEEKASGIGKYKTGIGTIANLASIGTNLMYTAQKSVERIEPENRHTHTFSRRSKFLNFLDSLPFHLRPRSYIGSPSVLYRHIFSGNGASCFTVLEAFRFDQDMDLTALSRPPSRGLFLFEATTLSTNTFPPPQISPAIGPAAPPPRYFPPRQKPQG
jgi:hypothetical protein